MTKDGIESSAILTTLSATSALASGETIFLGKRQRSSTDVRALLGKSFDYFINKLSKYSYTYNEVNISLEKNIKAMVEEDNTNTESIILNILITIVGLLYTVS